MRRATIFANGSMDLLPDSHDFLPRSDFVIAADGGAQHCIALGILPQVIIGDFDSLDEQALSEYKNNDIELIRFPARKDETDLELALTLALKRGFDEVFIIAALGDRWDMSIANILLLTKPEFSNMKIRLLDKTKEMLILRGGDCIEINSKAGCTLSLIPLAGNARGISTQGLEYPLNNETLFIGSTRGISNIFTKTNAQLTLSEGLLLCIYERAEE